MRNIGRIVIVLLCIMLLAGCYTPPSQQPVPTPEAPPQQTAEQLAVFTRYKIGILTSTLTHDWIEAAAYYAQRRCMELQDFVEHNIYYSADAAQLVLNTQLLLDWGMDALVIFPEWTGAEGAVRLALAAGIPVVSFDQEIQVDGIYHVMGDHYDIGAMSAKYIAEKLNGKGTVVVFEVPESGQISALRKAGFVERIAQLAPGIAYTVYQTRFTREDGKRDFLQILQAEQHIDAVVALDDEVAMGVLEALEEAGRTEVRVITGGGGAQAYYALMPEYTELYLMSATYSPSMARIAVDTALAVLRGQQTDRVYVLPTTVVDRDNVSLFLDEHTPY